MSATLHIDGLVASVGEQELKGMFAQFGDVLSVHMYQCGTPTGSGIGTVEMASLLDAQKAISVLHRSYMGGLLLLVFLASLGTQTLMSSMATLRTAKLRCA